MKEYTIEQFKEDFEDAQTPEAKQEVLLALLDSDIDIFEHKEVISEYKSQLQDLRDRLDVENDDAINIEIEQGFMKLYTCVNPIKNYKQGSNYYARIDDVKTLYTESFEGGDVPETLKELI